MRTITTYTIHHFYKNPEEGTGFWSEGDGSYSTEAKAIRMLKGWLRDKLYDDEITQFKIVKEVTTFEVVFKVKT